MNSQGFSGYFSVIERTYISIKPFFSPFVCLNRSLPQSHFFFATFEVLNSFLINEPGDKNSCHADLFHASSLSPLSPFFGVILG